MIEIKIPLPAYLTKYMQTIYGNPFTLSGDDEVGIYLMQLLQCKTRLAYHYHYQEKNTKQTPLTLHLTPTMAKVAGLAIPEEKIPLIHKYLDNRFRGELYRQAILAYHNHGIPYKDTLLSALETYKIDESELSYDTLRRDFNRKKEALEERLIYRK